MYIQHKDVFLGIYMIHMKWMPAITELVVELATLYPTLHRLQLYILYIGGGRFYHPLENTSKWLCCAFILNKTDSMASEEAKPIWMLESVLPLLRMCVLGLNKNQNKWQKDPWMQKFRSLSILGAELRQPSLPPIKNENILTLHW